MEVPAEAKGLKKLYRNLIKPASPSTGSPPTRCKAIAFHHAGYDPETMSNTVMFRLKGSPHYGGAVCGKIVWMILACLVESEALGKIKFSRKRGGPLHYVEAGGMFTADEYYVHSPDPNDETNILYRFALIPSFDVWKIPPERLRLWSIYDKSSMKRSRSANVRRNMEADMELLELCNKAVVGRDKVCVLSGVAIRHNERAFVVPLERIDFWLSEGLDKQLGHRAFSSANSSILHPMNGVAMHRDLRDAYEKGQFVFLPVRDRWRAHFFDPESKIGKEFDQERAKISEEIPLAFLIVRIAMAAFDLAKDFIEQDGVLQEGGSQGAVSEQGEDVSSFEKLIDVD